MKPEGGAGGRSFSPSAALITRSIVIACVVVQFVVMVGGDALSERLALVAGLIPGRLGETIFVPGGIWPPLTLLTSLFLHAGWLHLILNLSFLFWVGRWVEQAIGRWAFAGLFTACGIAGGLLQVAASPDSAVPVIGASGAIAGVFATYAVLFARNRAGARNILGLNLTSEITTALWYAATWIGLQLLTAIVFNTGGSGIAIWSHIGGFVAGLVIAQPFARRLRRQVD